MSSDVPDDPLLKPASEAGWDQKAEPAAKPEPEPDAKPEPDEPLLPATSSENELRAAVGAKPLPEAAATPAVSKRRAAPVADVHGDKDDDDHDDDDPHPAHSRRAVAVAVLSLAVGVGIVTLVFLGRANSDRYLLTCEAERAVPRHGRAFPPWGTRALDGDAWRPLKIAPETRCLARETDDPHVLERWYLDMILEAVTAQLTAREITKLDDTEALLKQGLLLTRPATGEAETVAAERTDHHKDIERLLGDVAYWRASARLREAANVLTDAARQFDSAAAQHPRHVIDAALWASYARKLADQLHAGPAGGMPGAASAPLAPSADLAAHPVAPPGTALPVEPERPSSAEPGPLAPPPDAGVPTGGVLL
ncbi:MAG TPA: hypothetical protein VH165_02265 [Kofleriaceae bacterium]|nr:hypothetical protein [Kofleriaceae bacterium]